ncbi:MAG: SGNH/GDSL hydrolase family protein [Ferruginibacter sp.]
MKYFVALLIIVTGIISLTNGFGLMNNRMLPEYADTVRKNYLALGDSYTIGQSVPASESFPHALAEQLNKSGIPMNEPEIRAVTGWTTGDLIRSLRAEPPALKQYDLVTLLIGVNNQFRGGCPREYAAEFRILLDEALKYAGDKRKLLIISIPDYSVTPFAAETDVRAIANGINSFNKTQQSIADEYGIKFINITPISRKGLKDNSLHASDGLHPSGKQYLQWAKKILPDAKKSLEQGDGYLR